MPRRYSLAASVLVFAWLYPMPAKAEIYKCVAANGDITFSQVPCPEEDSKVTTVRAGSSPTAEPADCEHARRFALRTAQQMKSGTGSSAIFDSYGGLSALSKGSVGLISYVFEFRTNADVSATRVSALATAKCRAGSFGDVSCEQLPASFTNSFGGCSADEQEIEATSYHVNSVEGTHAQATHVQSLARTNTTSQADSRKARAAVEAAAEKKRLECRDRYDSQIDAINERMRSGYSSSEGESHRKRRRDLEQKRRDC